MELTWRTPLKKYIEEHYIQRPQEWFDLDLSPSGRLNMTIVSNRFAKLPLEERREQIRQLLHERNAPTATGFLSLYTPDEAESIRLSRPHIVEEKSISNWLDLAHWAANAEDEPRIQRRKPGIPRTVAFYSFKGGVGRTTALVHVATLLAMRGRRVVAVDLDMEAPGLSAALNLKPLPKYGLVDYFYERSYMPEEVEPEISITELFGEVSIPDAPGRLFVVPAGSLNLDYLARVDDLRASTVTGSGEDLWSLFYREITEQLQPDIILVDSRTGINDWTAFSLLRAADKVMLFLYPNEQNSRGVGLLLEALLNTISISFVFSPVPFVNEGGMEMVRRQMEVLRTVQKSSGVNGKGQVELGEPIVIPYITGIAMANSYPVRELLSYYAPIADIIDEETNALRLSTVLADSAYKQELLESLTFPELDTSKEGSVYELFQPTADFDKFLDPATCLIRGRKGTGKSTLYWLWLKHRPDAMDLSFGRLRNVTFLSCHGPLHPGPTLADFQRVDQAIAEHRGSWEAFWRSYLLLRMYMNNQLQESLNKGKFKVIRSLFQRVPAAADRWSTEYTTILIEMITNPNLEVGIRDILRDIEEQQRKKGRAMWFLYDSLDDDLKGEAHENILVGLLQFVQHASSSQIRFKVFLREETWRPLVFDSKRYFFGRDLLLRWTFIDCLRLTLRQAWRSEKFQELVNRFSPLKSLNQASEEQLHEVLQPLWGNRWDINATFSSVPEWIYDRLADGGKSIFPPSLNIMLREAKKCELESLGEQSLAKDRLLSLSSLQQGLVKASQERCDEIRRTYPELQPLFDALAGKDKGISSQDLRNIWQKALRKQLPGLQDFNKFIDYLVGIGLTDRPSGDSRDEWFYTIPPLYQYGLGMKTDPDVEPSQK